MNQGNPSIIKKLHYKGGINLNRQDFESLSIEQQISYMNERGNMKLKDIAAEIGIPASTLSQLFIKAGYTRKSGIYTKETRESEKTKESVVSAPDELKELIQYKDELISLVLRSKQEEKALDFSVLNEYKDESRKINWSTLTFQIPTELHTQLDEYLEMRGYKKQFLLSLIIKQFLEK